MVVALRVRFFELESVLGVDLTPVGSTMDCELLQGKSHVLFFASAFSSLANTRPQKKKKKKLLKEYEFPGIVSFSISFSHLYHLKFILWISKTF